MENKEKEVETNDIPISTEVTGFCGKKQWYKIALMATSIILAICASAYLVFFSNIQNDILYSTKQWVLYFRAGSLTNVANQILARTINIQLVSLVFIASTFMLSFHFIFSLLTHFNRINRRFDTKNPIAIDDTNESVNLDVVYDKELIDQDQPLPCPKNKIYALLPAIAFVILAKLSFHQNFLISILFGISSAYYFVVYSKYYCVIKRYISEKSSKTEQDDIRQNKVKVAKWLSIINIQKFIFWSTVITTQMYFFLVSYFTWLAISYISFTLSKLFNATSYNLFEIPLAWHFFFVSILTFIFSKTVKRTRSTLIVFFSQAIPTLIFFYLLFITRNEKYPLNTLNLILLVPSLCSLFLAKTTSFHLLYKTQFRDFILPTHCSSPEYAAKNLWKSIVLFQLVLVSVSNTTDVTSNATALIATLFVYIAEIIPYVTTTKKGSDPNEK